MSPESPDTDPRSSALALIRDDLARRGIRLTKKLLETIRAELEG